MTRGLFVAVVVGALSAGCVKTETKSCGDFVCSVASVCAPSGDRCVSALALDSCQGKVDGDSCSYPGVDVGVCDREVCIAAGCGNGVIDLANEVCDDGNLVSFDGCSADCTSNERCGNGIVDAWRGETCDCGDATVVAPPPGCLTKNSDAPGDACRTDCTLARCGDGVLDPGEYCDDGNTRAGDGCRADCAGRWTAMASKTYLELHDIWGADAANVFAVGEQRVLRYDGVEWNVMPFPTGMAAMTLELISGTSPTDIMVASQQAVFHYNGLTWTTVTPSSGFNNVATLVMTGPGDGWMIGTDTNKVTQLWRWNGTFWSLQSLPTGFLGAVDMWAASPQSVYATMVDGQQLWHFNGTDWTELTDSSASIPARLITGAGPSDILALKKGSTSIGNGSYHFTGTTWPFAACCDDMDEMHAVGGVAGDYILVGRLGQIMRFDGTSWAIEPAETSGVTLRGVWGYAQGHAFVVGDGGAILY